MSQRNIWSHEETVALLSIVEEKNCLKHFDGKKYRNSEIYKMIQCEMKAKGFLAKTEKQIEIRWKNLKFNYMNTKKHNAKSGSGRMSSQFFEELDRLFGTRPSVISVNTGIDSSKEFNGESNAVQNEDGNAKENEEPQPSCSHSKKILKTGKGSYARNMDVLAQKICKVQEDITENFATKQKELIDYEFNLYQRQEKEYEERFEMMIKKNTDDFLKGLESILQNKNTVTPNEDLPK